MKTIKKATAAILAVMMICSCGTLTAFAKDVNSVGSVEADQNAAADAVIGKDTNQDKATAYQTVPVEDGTVPCDVYATQAAGQDVYAPDDPNADEDGFVNGSVELLLPKTVILSGETGIGKYIVAARGNINGTSYIKAQPVSSFTMTSTGKDPITASISQPVQRFCISTSTIPAAGDLAKTVTLNFADTVAVGDITAPLTAGQWHGTPTFTVGLTDTAA